MICFTLATFHAAPLSHDFAGFAVNQDEKMFLGTGPDRIWLGFTQKQSMGIYAHSPAMAFDPQAQYILNYHFRRQRLESKNKKNDTIRLANGEQWWTE
jgi:hypothetical protein